MICKVQPLEIFCIDSDSSSCGFFLSAFIISVCEFVTNDKYIFNNRLAYLNLMIKKKDYDQLSLLLNRFFLRCKKHNYSCCLL